MINFCVLKFGKELKGRSTIDLVNEIVEPIKDTKDIALHCYTDNHDGIDGRFNVYELSEEDKEKHIHWNMMKFFDPEFIGAKETDQTIYMDIDVTWNKDPSPMINHVINSSEILGIDRHWKTDETNDDCNLHDSFLKFNSHDFKYIEQWYFSDPKSYQTHYYENKKVSVPRYGVQNFIWESVNKVAGKNIKFLPSHYVMKSHKDKYSIYAEQYSKKTGRDYYKDFDEAILHYLT